MNIFSKMFGQKQLRSTKGQLTEYRELCKELGVYPTFQGFETTISKSINTEDDQDKLNKVLQWVLDVNVDLYENDDDEVVPGVTLKEIKEMM